MDNHYQVYEYKRSYNELVKDRTFTPLGRYKDCFYISKRKLFFKEEQDRINYELLGDIIANNLEIDHTNYQPCIIKTTSREIKGLISKDYRIPNHLLIKFDKILENKDMKLDNILISLNMYFKDYHNREEIIKRIYNDVIKHYMLDLLLGNIDNGKYNYELIVGDDNAYLSPYTDFGMIFNFTSTNLRVNNEVDNSLYNNLRLLLTNDLYYKEFIKMYKKITPERMEELLKEVEDNKNISLGDNFKNIVFLSYMKHYLIIDGIIKEINKDKRKRK